MNVSGKHYEAPARSRLTQRVLIVIAIGLRYLRWAGRFGEKLRRFFRKPEPTDARCRGRSSVGYTDRKYRASRSLFSRWGKLLPIALTLLCTTQEAISSSTSDIPSNIVHWPMDKYGNRWIDLKVSRSIAGKHVADEAMNQMINPSRPADEPLIKQLLFYALWPDLSTDSDAIQDAVRSQDPRLIMALLESGATASFKGKNYDRLQIDFDVAVDFSTHDICIMPYEWPSDPHPTQSKCLTRKAPDVKSPEFGLSRIGIDFTKYPNIPNATRKGLYESDLYYVRGTDGRLLTFIRCAAIETAPDNLPAPDADRYGCDHRFISAKTDALVSLTYPRAYLKSWREMERRWNELIDSFVTTPPYDRKRD